MLGTVALAAPTQRSLATVVEIDGIQGFDRMRQGAAQLAADTGHDAFRVGPAQADPWQQVALREDMIARGVDALAVVPMSPEAVEPVPARARRQGIDVISREAAMQRNVDHDIGSFRNEDFGADRCSGSRAEWTVRADTSRS
jgi:simple sugar transport system substrate-binding protein